MKKHIIAVLTLMLAFAAASGCSPASAADDGTISIGILQIADHLSLDNAREGFISGLADEGWVEGENLRLMPFSAQGDISIAHAMANQIVESNPDLILGIATTTSQTLANTTETIPIVITAVTDPLRANLVESLERPGRNVTGTSDLSPVGRQFELLTQLLPEARTVGIIYNVGEINSQVLADMATEKAAELGLEYVTVTVASTADVAQATQSIVGRVDVIYTPTCNTVASAIAVVTAIAEEAGVPVIGGNANHVNNGALATEGVDYYRLGRQASAMAAQILRGEAVPAEMPIQWQDDLSMLINISAAERFGITIPEEILAAADLFEE
jgi:putative ABC transport system substrate-binding protein